MAPLCAIIIDEVAEFAIPELLSFLNRVRGAKTNVLIAHYTRSDLKSVREVEEFMIHWNRIKRIEQGEALVISRTLDTEFGLVAAPRARVFDC